MSETTAEKRSLVKKLAEVMGEVERVAKNGRNQSQGYDYATEADIAAAVRGGLASRSLMMLPSVEKTEWSELATRNGGKLRLCTLTVRFTLEDGDSGETRSIVAVGEGTDSGDKASYKAMTGAEKYALMKLFLIPTGDDPERDDRRAPAVRQPVRQAPRPPPQEPPPDMSEGERIAAEPGPEGEDVGPVVPFGKNAGKPMGQLSTKQLDAYIGLLQKGLADPEKSAAFKAKDKRHLADFERVRRLRGYDEPADGGSALRSDHSHD